MKTSVRVRILIAATLSLPSVSLAQAPALPRVPAADKDKAAEAAAKAAARAKTAEAAAEAAKSAEKSQAAQAAAAKAENAQKAAEKADAAQKASAKAEAAQRAAAKAEAAQKAAERASQAQKAAEKAQTAGKAAEKVTAIQRTAEKASQAQRAAEKADAAQKAAAKAEVAQKAAEKAQSAGKAAEKSGVAQRVAAKAEAAQKAASKAETAQKAAEKSSAARRVAERATSAQKAAGKAQSAQAVASKAEAAGKAGEKTSIVQRTAEKAAAAQKASEKAQAATKRKTEALIPRIATKPPADSPVTHQGPGSGRAATAPAPGTLPPPGSEGRVTHQGPGTGKASAAPAPGSLAAPGAPPAETTTAAPAKKPGLLQRLFGARGERETSPAQNTPAAPQPADSSPGSGTQTTFEDGSVKFTSESISSDTSSRLSQGTDGEAVGDFDAPASGTRTTHEDGSVTTTRETVDAPAQRTNSGEAVSDDAPPSVAEAAPPPTPEKKPTLLQRLFGTRGKNADDSAAGRTTFESQAPGEDTTPRQAPNSGNTRVATTAEELSAANPEAGGHTQDEVRQAVREDIADKLEGLHVGKEDAALIAKDAADGGKESGKVVETISKAVGDLQLVGVPHEKQKDIVRKVVDSPDPDDAAEREVGNAATEQNFGKDIANMVPPEKRGQFRGVFRNLLTIQAELKRLGGDLGDPEVQEAIKEGARRGVSTTEETKEVVEKAGQKILDRDGFSPAKPGETLGQRLVRLAAEQKAEVEAEQHNKALAALGKLLPGGAGSTVRGRSVSAKVEVGVGGGKGNASGAGTETAGRGIDTTRSAGVGGSVASTAQFLDARLVAGSGGTANKGAVTTGDSAATQPGTEVAAATEVPVAEVPAAQAPGTGVPVEQPAPAQPASAPVNEGGNSPASRSGEVVSPESEIVVGGGIGESFTERQQSESGNESSNITYNPNGSFSGTVTVVTRNENGEITSVTTIPVSGTWGIDGDGKKEHTSTTVGTPTTTETAKGSEQQQNQNPSSSETGGGGETEGGDAQASATPDPNNTEEGEGEEPASAEEQTTADSTENPEAEPRGTGLRMGEATGGRVGGSEARRTLRGIALAAEGGGAGGPSNNPEQSSSAPGLLTPEERSAAAKLLGIKRGGGVSTPADRDTSATVTDRDLKDLSLRGTGGAKGPTEGGTAPPPPQDPNSPITGPGPIAPPSGRANVPARAIRIQGVQVEKIEVKGVEATGR